jgi:Flagellar basal body-associated protein FliL
MSSENPISRSIRLSLLQWLIGTVGLPLALLCMLVSSVGCFNADALIEARQMIVMRTRLEEVDLGEFRVSLPHAAEKTENAELYFHVFGQVPNRDLSKVKEAIKKNRPEIQHSMLIAARTMTAEQLEDPQLKDLRKSFAKVVNESLEGNPVQSIGFYRFGYMSF